MKRRKSRVLRVVATGAGIALTLTACFLPAEPGDGAAPSPTASLADETAPSQADPRIVVLADDEVTPLPTWERSTPAGTWEVGPGVPPGFPAGVPVFPDRWIKNNQLEFDSGGRSGYSSMFWGDYADVEQLVLRLGELGFDVERQQDETKQVVVADSDRYRVVITATESAQNPGEAGLLDPSYTIVVVAQD